MRVRDLIINKDKTEQYFINKTTYEWRKCKYLGSMFDTKEDKKRRKVLAINAANIIKLFSLTRKSPQKQK